INAADSGFVLWPEDVQALRDKGVPDIVIRAMYARQTGDRLVLPTAPVSAASAATTTTPAAAPLATAPAAVPTSAEVASHQAISNVASPRVAKHNGTGETRAFPQEGTYGLDKGSIGQDHFHAWSAQDPNSEQYLVNGQTVQSIDAGGLRVAATI